MCGIAGVAGPPAPEAVRAMLSRISHRGPDHSGLVMTGGLTLGHARLSIVDPGARSNQPFSYGRVLLAFNGEVWNWRELRAELEAGGRVFETEGDTEVVAAALDAWDEAALRKLNGMFAVAWTSELGEAGGGVVKLARDRHGEVPLHLAPFEAGGWAFASELKALPYSSVGLARWVEPGRVYEISHQGISSHPYAGTGPGWSEETRRGIGLDEAAAGVGARLIRSCEEREMADVPVCAMLSGGVDSAAICALLKRGIPDLVAYTAVLDSEAGRKSRDLRMARVAAEATGVELVEVPVPEPTAEDLSRVVEEIEMPHKAQVEIGWACLVLAERMRADGFKVTYSGEGSDELWGSYGFAYHALGDDPTDREFRRYRRDLFAAQHRKNFARANKAFMTAGVECRLPFLNPRLVSYALSLPRTAVADGKRRPKAVLQRAAASLDLLPKEIVRRPKVAFQDGMGMKAAAARAVADPKRYYKAEYGRLYGRAA